MQVRGINLPKKLQKLCNGEKTVELAADNFAQICSGLRARFGQAVHSVIAQGSWMVKFDEKYTNEENIHNLGNTKEINILTPIKGAGKAGSIILGIVMVVVGVFMIWNGTGALAIAQGVAMMAGGLMNIYTAMNMPSMSNSKEDEQKSFTFNGAVNTVEQGGAVPIVYGVFETGSVVASAGIYAEQMTKYSTAPSSNPAPNSAFGVAAI